jgi:adenine deaminase
MAALQIATISTARHYRLRNFGAIAPRYWADFIVFDNLKKLVVRQTYKKGILVAEDGMYLAPQRALVPRPRSTMNLRCQAPEDFQVRVKRGARMRVIEIVPNHAVCLTRAPSSPSPVVAQHIQDARDESRDEQSRSNGPPQVHHLLAPSRPAAHAGQ